ncbi:hypothetical protein RYA05_03955 [Pseudomonas syringae pv. actinidiae]|nr:hypothetical protein [Pseudomonas syringae pv. actinidiae]
MITEAQQTMQDCGFDKDIHEGLGAPGGALWLKAKVAGATWCPDQRQIQFNDGSRIRFVSNPASLYATTYQSH